MVLDLSESALADTMYDEVAQNLAVRSHELANVVKQKYQVNLQKCGMILKIARLLR